MEQGEHAAPHTSNTKTKEKGKKNKGGKKGLSDESKPGKTFNRLDARFQLEPHHGPEHIFPEEYEMIKTLRERVPACANMSDKTLVAFLCARRHDMQAVTELLERHLNKMRELGFDTVPPTSEDAVKVFESGMSLRLMHCVDKYGRLVSYYKIAYDNPKRTTLKEKLAMMFFYCYHLTQKESLKYIRNGSILIIDMHGFGWSNLDLSSTGREVNDAMSGLFVDRIRKMYVVNGGFLLKAVMKAGKLILPKKLMKRVVVLESGDLQDLIPRENLLKEYGGDMEFDLQKYFQQLRETTLQPLNPKQ